MKIEFFGDKILVTVANFCILTKKGFYNSLIFYRVIKGFMVQDGDLSSNGTGSLGYEFKDEIYIGNSNDKYIIAMINAGPNTNGGQFFISTRDNPFLNGKHTVFGKVLKEQEVIDKIENVEIGVAYR